MYVLVAMEMGGMGGCSEPARSVMECHSTSVSSRLAVVRVLWHVMMKSVFDCHFFQHQSPLEFGEKHPVEAELHVR